MEGSEERGFLKDKEVFVGSCSQPVLTDHEVWGQICLLAITAKYLGRDGHRNP